MQAVAALGEGEDLRLVAPFEPRPLFAVLGQQGFAYRSKPLASGDYEVLFSKDLPQETAETQAPPVAAPRAAAAKACAGPPTLDLDARGLEPPQPMVKILEAVATLPAGARLRARTDRRPMHLYAQLEARGFTGESEEQNDGSFITYIRRS